MSWDELNIESEEDAPRPGDDHAVREVQLLLLDLFERKPEAVFNESQLTVQFENDFFHWVTVRALKDLRESEMVGSDLQELTPKVPLRFYFHKRNRYWKRRASEIRKLILTYSDQSFTNALGVQGEMLIDAGLPRVGFLPMGANVRSWNGKTWPTTKHDLDRVFTRDGLNYGCEIKNRLGYIPRDEFAVKLLMCRDMGLIPLFVARMMPRTYIEEVRKEGGFCLLMKFQFYPVSHRALAALVRNEMGLPVDCPTQLADATLSRFLTWHKKKVERVNVRTAL